MRRRDVLKLGAVAATAVALPVERIAQAQARTGIAALEPFSVPLPALVVLPPVVSTPQSDYYEIVVQEKDVEILPGLRTRVRTFGGYFPGPTIRATRGKPVMVRQTNKLDVPVVVHLHGGHVPQSSDGHPLDEIAPGASRTYRYPNDQLGATLWYHEHSHHGEAENVYRGVAGTYLLTDPAELALSLPSGQFDVPLHLRDAQINQDGALVYDPVAFDKRSTILVNGRPQPYFAVAARKYRFRLLNTSTERVMGLKLSDGAEFVQIASDGGLLPVPAPTAELPLSSGERAEIVVDFSRYPVGSSVRLLNTQAYAGETGDVMRFDVTRTARDDSSIPSKLRTLPELGMPTVERELALSLDLVSGQFVINGATFDPNRVDLRTKVGTTEIWKITNNDTQFFIPHNFHTHLTQFQILDRDGVPPKPGEAGLKDTVLVQPGQSVRIKAKFADYTGRYVYHCHLLEHSVGAMMGQLEITR
jgi:spore coat protein A